jgi:hypothetical protein
MYAQNLHNGIMAKHSKHQDRIIRNYYENHDDLMLQRLGESVTDLYLAEGKARLKLWRHVAEILEKMKIPENEIATLVSSDDPTLVANLLQKLLKERG